MKMQSSSEKNAKRLLKVGFVFDDSLDSFDGVSQYVKSLGHWLSSQGHIVNYLVGETKMQEWSGGKVYSLSKNQKVSFNQNKLSVPLPANKKKIKSVLEHEKYDVLHIQMPYSPFMAGRVIKSADKDTAIFGTFHILPANKTVVAGSYILKILYGRDLHRFDTIYSVSKASQSFAKKIFNIDSLVLPNVVDTGRFAVAKKPHKPVPEIIFLGRLVKRKGCFELLKAYSLAKRNGLNAKLIIAGRGPERASLEEFVRREQLDNDVEFKGFIEEEDKPELLARADIACFPATGGESFGIVLIEAMAAGSKVIVGGDNPGYRSVLGGRPELLVDPYDTPVFAERLTELLSNKTLISDLSMWLKKEVRQYDIETVGKQLEESYISAIAKRRSSLHNIDNEQR